MSSTDCLDASARRLATIKDNTYHLVHNHFGSSIAVEISPSATHTISSSDGCGNESDEGDEEEGRDEGDEEEGSHEGDEEEGCHEGDEDVK